MGLLRLWLAFCVLRFHTTALGSSWMPDGHAAVQAFFVLSGFSMAMLQEEKYHSDRAGFWKRRLLRIWPAYLAAVAVVLGWESWLWFERHTSAGFVHELLTGPRPGLAASLLLSFSNLTLLGQDFLALIGIGPDGSLYLLANPFKAYFVASHYTVLPQAWSLSIELAFYALAPWYVRLSTKSLIAIVLGGIALRAGLIALGLPANPWAFRLTPVELSTFALGILSWRMYQGLSGQAGFWHAVLGWIGVLSASSMAEGPLVQSLCLGGVVALALPYIFRASKYRGWDRTMGEWAYPLYLIHQLAAYMGLHLAYRLDVTPRFWALALLCLGMAVLFWAVMKKPLQLMERRFHAA